ncbi:MAG TPA: chorismate-binding protein, partial [Cyclobacteriaceae bacterium]|nr:chorismate-binding protein [Cyclobacteriaceae bacterium]
MRAQTSPKNSRKYFYTQPVEGTDSDKEHYQQLVKKGMDRIAAGAFEKIVPSRSKRVDLPGAFDAIETFQKLCDTYPNAM